MARNALSHGKDLNTIEGDDMDNPGFAVINTHNLAQLTKWRDEINAQMFSSEVPICTIDFFPSRKKLSECRAIGRKILDIRISDQFLCSEQQIKISLAHEMIHALLAHRGIIDDGIHGSAFRAEATRIQTSHREFTIRTRDSCPSRLAASDHGKKDARMVKAVIIETPSNEKHPAVLLVSKLWDPPFRRAVHTVLDHSRTKTLVYHEADIPEYEVIGIPVAQRPKTMLSRYHQLSREDIFRLSSYVPSLYTILAPHDSREAQVQGEFVF
jgi:hypothetical protein